MKEARGFPVGGKGLSSSRSWAAILFRVPLSRSVRETSAADESAGTMARQATAATKAFILF